MAMNDNSYTVYAGSPRTVKRTTTTKEYDEKGRCVRETTVEETTTEQSNVYPYWVTPTVWPQYPTITYTSGNTQQVAGTLVNGSPS